MTKPYNRNDLPDLDPEYAEHIRETLIPNMVNTAMAMCIIPDDPAKLDLKIVMEMGLMVLLDKPIIAVVSPGIPVPENIINLAEAIVEMNNPPTEEDGKRMQETITWLISENPRFKDMQDDATEG